MVSMKTWISCILLLVLLAACTTIDDSVVPASSSVESTIGTPKTSVGEVTVGLTPLGYADGILTVGYSMNTHTVDMSDIDLQRQTTLLVGSASYTPLSRPVLSGHHNSGELRFRLPSMPDAFGIIILDVPDVAERRFSWP